MRIKMIEAAEAPRSGKPANKGLTEVTELIMTLEAGKVAVITPEKDQSLRGLKSRLTRAGNREGRKVNVWEVEGRIYCELAETEG
ncbi:hypothetical protein G3V86_24650 [Escherichia coli]|nr:hypothetical protein [Escherichia coli]